MSKQTTDLRDFQGKWVATDSQDRVVVSAKTARLAQSLAQQKKVKDPAIFLVPATFTGGFIGYEV